MSSKGVVGAAQRADFKALQQLARQGADFNVSYRNYRPLHALIQEKPHGGAGGTERRNECLKWLIGQGANPDLDGAWPSARAILVATWVGEPLYIQTLLDAGAVVDGFVSAAMGDTTAVRRALKRSADFARQRDPQGLTALHCTTASRVSNLKMAELLLDHGAEPEAKVRSWGHDVDAVYFAVHSGQKEAFELLLERGADPSSALVPAAWRPEPDFAGIAMRYGANADKAVDGDRPLLNNLVRWGQIRQAQWLLDQGADPNLPGPGGWTAVHHAASRGNERLWKMVLAAGGDPTCEEESGSSADRIRQSRKSGRCAQT